MSDLFGKLYNPDVLTCLANLSNDEVFTPPEVVNQMLDMLPAELFESTETTFLDPCTKSGVFLREIAKRLIEAQIPGYEEIAADINIRELSGEELTEDDLAFRKKLEAVTEHIFKNQLFGIAITELTSLISRRSVYCTKSPHTEYAIVQFDDPKGNIEYEQMEHNWVRGKCSFCGVAESEYERGESSESYAYQFIHLYEPEKVFNMKFDVIIGNPPYQMSDGGNQASAKPIYQHFIQQAKRLNPRYLTMIVPARWYAGGKGLDAFRDEMISDKRIRILHDYINSEDCFGTSVEIKSGVCFFLWDRDNPGRCTIHTHETGADVTVSTRYMKEGDNDVFIRRTEAVQILDKVMQTTTKTFDELVSSRRPFGFSTDYSGIAKPKQGAVKLLKRNEYGWTSQNEITRNNDWVNEYKVYITKAYNAGDDFPHQIINKPLIGEPGTCCTETYIVVGPFKDVEETKNVISYMQTKFFRFLVSIRKISQDATSKVYKFVPMQDFSKAWTDKELYDKYDLTQEERNYIESLIKPMELED